MKIEAIMPSKDIFETPTSHNDRVYEEPQSLFWLDRIEYPTEGGTLRYLFGADVEEQEGELKEYVEHDEQKINDILLKKKEEGWILKNNQVPKCGHCGYILFEFIKPHKVTNRRDLLYPDKGLIEPDALSATNKSKRFLIGFIRFFAQKSVLFCFSFMLFLPWKTKIRVAEKWLNIYSSLSDMVLSPFYLKENLYMPFSRELRKFIELFLLGLGINEAESKLTAKVVATLFEYDFAYRIRSEDILSEATVERLLANPSREIKRLVAIYVEREYGDKLKDSFGKVGKLAALLLLHPHLRRVFRETMQKIDFSKLQYDEADRYHVLRIGPYKFLGQDWKERAKKFLELHNGLPPVPIEVTIE